jgi:hypothetical protein
MEKTFSSFILLSLLIGFPWSAACDAAGPVRPHYVVRDDTIIFTSEATDSDLVILDSHPELRTIDLGGSGPWCGPDPRGFPIKITNVGFAHIVNCKNLETLRFGFTQPHQVTDDGLKSLEGLKKLRVIQFGVTPFTSAGLSHLAGLINLEELWLDFNPQYDDDAMIPIAKLQKLQVLSSKNCGCFASLQPRSRMPA